MPKFWSVPEEDVMCAICLTCWIHKDPILLHCSHTFCSKCIQNLVRYNGKYILTCPSCRTAHPLVSRDVSKLPRNIMFSNAVKQNQNKEYDIEKRLKIDDANVAGTRQMIMNQIDLQVDRLESFMKTDVHKNNSELKMQVERFFQIQQEKQNMNQPSLQFQATSKSSSDIANCQLFKQVVKTSIKFIEADFNLGKVRQVETKENFDLTENSRTVNFEQKDISIRGIFFINSHLYTLEERIYPNKSFTIVKQDFNLENGQIFSKHDHELTNAFVDKGKVYMNDFNDSHNCLTVKFNLQTKHVKKLSVSKFLHELQNFRSVGHKDIVATSKSHIMRIKDGKILWTEKGFRSLSEVLLLKVKAEKRNVAKNKDNFDISIDNLRGHLEKSFSFKRSHFQPEAKEICRHHIHDFFVDLANENSQKAFVDVHNFTSNSEDDNGNLAEGANYIYVLKGSNWGTSADNVILIGSHYDSQTNTSGVDDSGSGMAALYEITKLLTNANCPQEHTIVFAAFDFEEFGLQGSAEFVDDWLLPNILQKFDTSFQVALILETIMNYDFANETQTLPFGTELLFPDLVKLLRDRGMKSDFLAIIGRQDENEIMKELSDTYYTVDDDHVTPFHALGIEIPKRGWVDVIEWFFSGLYDFLRSDHTSFWTYDGNFTDVGLKALFITDTANFRGYMRTCYHFPCDNMERTATEENLKFLRRNALVFTKYLYEKTRSNCDLKMVTAK
ncbi:DgyrCDS12004 [Dimorphilus gyrociliatus]|uniref:DgyrCDS12004 n=1 Tax=Dimorphilus gyrociliatus TaxID=2664684 RepID=A0A7I8W7J2_9ANNE|nr:DgyrCDS12004 [Dimorphilus gyrociliatus]